MKKFAHIHDFGTNKDENVHRYAVRGEDRESEIYAVGGEERQRHAARGEERGRVKWRVIETQKDDVTQKGYLVYYYDITRCVLQRYYESKN